MKVYLAAPLAEAPRVHQLAADLFDLGLHVVSTWHATTATVDPHDEDVRLRVLEGNLAELAHADVLVAVTDRGTPRATFAEIGYALARRTRVIWLAGAAGAGRCIFDAHTLVTRVTSWADVLDVVRPHRGRSGVA